MANGLVPPSNYKISSIQRRLMQPALTSHFQCYFNPPPKVQERLKDNELTSDDWGENLLITCSEASLPGSQLATNELNNDFTGVTQRHAYRRLYDDRADFTFYVNHRYSQISVFECWMRYIAGEQISSAANLNQFYRMQYPSSYKTPNLTITKFERDLGAEKVRGGRSGSLNYTFVNAFPVAMNSMPVSYDTAQLLKCTVSFSYDRYFVKFNGVQVKDSQSPQTPEQQATQNQQSFQKVPFRSFAYTDQNLDFNIAPSKYNFSSGTLTNTLEGEEIINSRPRRVEEGLPYVGRNRGPMERWSGI